MIKNDMRAADICEGIETIGSLESWTLGHGWWTQNSWKED